MQDAPVTPVTAPDAPAAPMLVSYRWLRSLTWLALSFYYEDVEVHGAELIPPEGPLLVIANHQISLVDPLLLAHAVPRPLRYLAKASLFRVPGLALLMRTVGAIPVHRREDGRANHSNTALYDDLARALAGGAAIGIFPEGVSHDNPMLGELRHGAAKIALDAEEAADFHLGLRVQVVGIHIEDSRLFRGRVLLNVAPPFTLEGYARDFRADPRATVEGLTARLREQLKTCMLEAEDHEDLALAGLIETLGLLPASEPGMHGTFARKKFILDQYRELRAAFPAQVRLVRELLILYRDALAFHPPAPAAGESTDRLWLHAIARLLWQVLVVAPVIALGVAANALPFYAIRLLAVTFTRLQRRGQDVRASLGIMLGVPIFLAWYAGLAWLALTSAHPWLSLPLVVAAPIAGLTAVSRLASWKQAIRKLLVSFASYLTRGAGPGQRASTERLRELLREQIKRLHDMGRPAERAP